MYKISITPELVAPISGGTYRTKGLQSLQVSKRPHFLLRRKASTVGLRVIWREK